MNRQDKCADGRFDLLELLADITSCRYISDLRIPRYGDKAKLLMAVINLDEYDLDDLSETARYLYQKDVSFEEYSEARVFFTRRLPARCTWGLFPARVADLCKEGSRSA